MGGDMKGIRFNQREQEKLVTFEEAAAILGLRVSTLRKWRVQRRIPIVRVSTRAIRIPVEWVLQRIREGYEHAVEKDDHER